MGTNFEQDSLFNHFLRMFKEAQPKLPSAQELIDRLNKYGDQEVAYSMLELFSAGARAQLEFEDKHPDNYWDRKRREKTEQK